MLKRKVWKIVLPGVIAIKIFVIISLLNASFKKPESIIVEGMVRYKSIPIPDTLFFAGEKVPLEYFDVRENLERELLVNSYFHSQTIRLIKLAPRYFSVIEPILKEKGIPDDFKYLAVAESNLDPRAVSPAQAVGLWQFLRTTGREYGLEITDEVDERYHVEKSTYAACEYLNSAYEKFENWALVAAAYNSGRSFTIRQMERQKNNNYYDMLLGEETERYVFRILALKMVLEKPEEFGFEIPENEKYPVINTRNIEIKRAVEDFAAFASDHGTNYKLLKMFNPWLRENFLTNNTGKTYVIKVPAEGARTENISSNQE